MERTMSTCEPVFDLPERLGYVQCSFCTTILLVSVPNSSLLKMVTVKCGHCTGLLSVSLVRTSFVPMQLLTSLQDDLEPPTFSTDKPETSNHTETMFSSEDDDKEQDKELLTNMVIPVKKPPEKRQRTPSAYNHFIKEEILRIKASNPSIAHKQAFSMAAKNWALFPRTDNHCKEGMWFGSSKKARNYPT